VTGSCHCGANAITIARPPTFLYDCNCSLCRKSGALWGYFSTSEFRVSGTSTSYRREDKAAAKGALNFCSTCGSTTHWVADHDAGTWTCAVNMRLFDPALLSGLPVHYPDGAGWFGEGPFDFVREPSVHDGISH
jgi:hypothetical protein